MTHFHGRVESGRRKGGLWKESIMAGKDKGGRAAKTAASKTQKEKKQAKRDKKLGKSTSGL